MASRDGAGALHVSRVPRLILCLALLVAACFARPAVAQVSSELLSDPFDSRDLTRLLQQYVSPSVNQWIKIEAAHQAYLARFKLLEKTDFARHRAFVAEHMSDVPDAATLREFVRRLKSVRKILAGEDERLLQEISLILEETQQAGLLHIRKIRERERLTVAYAGRSNADQAVALWRILDRWVMDLTPAELQRVGLELSDYQARVIPLLQLWQSAQDSMLLAVVDELAASGIQTFPPADADPAELERTLARVRQGLEAARRQSVVTADKLEAINLRTVRALESLLPEGRGRQLRIRYLNRLHPDVRIDPDPGGLLAACLLLQADSDVPAELAAAVRDVLAAYLPADGLHLDRIAALLEKEAGQGATSDPERRVQLQQIQELRIELSQQVRRSLIALVEHSSDRRIARIFGPTGVKEFLSSADSGESAASSENIQDVDLTRGGPGDFISRPISTRSISELRALLEAESWIEAILETLYQDYLDDWREQVAPLVAQCKELQSNIHRYDRVSETMRVDRDSLVAAYGLAQQASRLVEQLDTAFFDDLLLTVSDELKPDVRRHHLQRALNLLLRGSDPIFSPRRVAYANPNVMSQLARLDLADEERIRVDAFLQSRVPELLALAARARDVRFDCERRIHELNQRMGERLADGSATSADYGMAYRGLSDELLATHGTTSLDWTQAYSAFAQALSDQLDLGNREGFNRYWLQASHPAVFRQAVDARPALLASLEFEDLSAEQVETITEVLVDYERVFADLSRELVEIDSRLGTFGAHTSEEDYEQWRVLQQQFKSAEFNRDQASMSVLRQLYLYLTPDQRARLPVLRGFTLD